MSCLSNQLFNSAIVCSSISACYELGIFDSSLYTNDQLDLESFCSKNKLDLRKVSSILTPMVEFEIFEIKPGSHTIGKGKNYQNVYENKGYFHWMIKGYSEILGKTAQFAKPEEDVLARKTRDGAAIANAGRDYGENFIDSLVNETLKTLNFNKIADLGCGSANRIIKLANNFNCKAVGVEINADGVQVATSAVSHAHLSNKIEILQGDVCNLQQEIPFKDVDLLTSFFMGHDLWPEDRCISIFKSFRVVFPNLKFFLFCDTFRPEVQKYNQTPIFTMGFQLFHDLMGQYIPTHSQWLELFKKAGWKCERDLPTQIPYTNLFLLSPAD